MSQVPERPVIDTDKIVAATKLFLEAIGEDPTRDGLLETPKRVARAWNEYLANDATFKATLFDSMQYDQMVIVSGIRYYSFCEHHILPFFGSVAVGYIPMPGEKIAGISKLARAVTKYAHRLQVQERLTDQIANEVAELVPNTKGIGVVVTGHHLCMAMRGAHQENHVTITSAFRGVLQEDQKARQEFLSLIRRADYERP